MEDNLLYLLSRQLINVNSETYSLNKSNTVYFRESSFIGTRVFSLCLGKIDGEIKMAASPFHGTKISSRDRLNKRMH